METGTLAVALASALSLISLGGGIYEMVVVDPAWPRRPDIIHPSRGGISRGWFWIPAHLAFELVLVAALYLTWSAPAVRQWLLIALVAHAIMRLWSAFDFIPKSLGFEKADTFDEEEARDWVKRSRWRLPLDLVTSASMLAAFAAIA